MSEPKKPHLRLFRSKKLHPEHVAAINRALRHNAKGKEHNVLIEYTKADGTKTDRKIRPLAVRGKHLLLAHDHNRGEVRSFRMDRVGMVKAAFWTGFEKQAKLSRVGKYMLRGAGIGSVPGVLVGASSDQDNRLRGALVGAGAGALVGTGAGFAAGKASIANQARRIREKATSTEGYTARLDRASKAGEKAIDSHMQSPATQERIKNYNESLKRFHEELGRYGKEVAEAGNDADRLRKIKNLPQMPNTRHSEAGERLTATVNAGMKHPVPDPDAYFRRKDRAKSMVDNVLKKG